VICITDPDFPCLHTSTMEPGEHRENSKLSVYWKRATGVLALLVIASAAERGLWRTTQQNSEVQLREGRKMPGGFSLSPEGEAGLKTFVDSDSLAETREFAVGKLKDAVKEFYASSNFSLAWISERRPTSQAKATIEVLKRSGEKGLVAEDYGGPEWDARVARIEQTDVPEADLVTFDVSLTIMAMKYVSDLSAGRANPGLFRFETAFDHEKKGLPEFVHAVAKGGPDVKRLLAGVEPPFPAYGRTIDALHQYQQLAGADKGGGLPPIEKPIRPGLSYCGVSRLHQLLILFGDMQPRVHVPSQVYDEDLAAGVRHFQERHGLEPSGVMDESTLEALNVPLSKRVTQLELTLERWRWVPHEFTHPPVVVNIPEFRLRADDEHYRWALSMKVVVGKAYEHQTPVFASEMRSVIFRPYWNVPLEIQRTEIVPKLQEDSAYLSEDSYDIVDRKGRVVEDDRARADVRQQLEAGQLGLRQKPGPENALGLIKFDSPNPFGIYLHGTPSAELFSRSRRDFSHGCIRVEDPFVLASWVLRGTPGWTKERIQEAMGGDRTVRVDLAEPVPLLIVYGTAVVLENGEVHFYDDIYAYDAALQAALVKHKGVAQRR